MLTYQDLLEVPDNDVARMDFVQTVISQHKGSDLYEQAIIADEYDRKHNRTIETFVRMLYTTSGEQVPDNYSVNFKMGRAFFPYFVTQEVQYLLGNGVSWTGESVEVEEGTEDAVKTKKWDDKTGKWSNTWSVVKESTAADKLGTQEKPFDTQLQEAGHKALVQGVSFGFFNLDHIDVFGVDEFAPLYDEENGALRAGVRFWQIDASKPLRATLYEEDGYTDYIWNTRRTEGKETEISGSVLHEKRTYKQTVKTSDADGTEIIDGDNYPGFPIVPLWGNKAHQSELTGLREQIDCYDLIKSGFANNVDEASYVYWAIQNAGGMDDIDLSKFVERMKTVHAAVVEDAGARAEPHSMEAPYASREALLSRLEQDIFKDAMALDIERIASGANTATQIRAAYEPLNEKTDGFEYCVLTFIHHIEALAGLKDEASFTRSTVANTQEEVTTVLTAAQALPPDYVTRKIVTILGDGDKADEIIDELHADTMMAAGMGMGSDMGDDLLGGDEGTEEEGAETEGAGEGSEDIGSAFDELEAGLDGMSAEELEELLKQLQAMGGK